MNGNTILSRLPVCPTRLPETSFGTREAPGALDVESKRMEPALRTVWWRYIWDSRTYFRIRYTAHARAADGRSQRVVRLGSRIAHGRHTRFRLAPAPCTVPSRQPAFALDRIWMHPAHRLIDATVHRSILPRAASGHLPLAARIAREHH
ncbi:endonuclease/exonuclease/phosphatase family protein [Paraburkholderia terrae]|uniref:hypothetical protein n=1 Tax=Paraburkholderia terrae TaxID=311230 RepID=UPI00296A9E83|nr:hypothetical protein [Paraburkholderia terrae]MDW3659667.1 hypothetical protein [Paraburkholderia terrae]